MSWQRVDENTYIDDTLVTCAEYQLFIDEMRKQGQYYQPDHWTSSQFPNSQARLPITGVCQSDVVAFCEWLTKREIGEWQFRLPTQDEADAFPIKAIGISPLGYWVSEKYKFNWIEPKPDPKYVAYREAIRNSILLPRTTRKWKHERAVNLALNRDNALDRDQNLDIAFELVRKTDGAKALDVYINLLTLQERKAGRSPAFEGIRLVKERIR